MTLLVARDPLVVALVPVLASLVIFSAVRALGRLWAALPPRGSRTWRAGALRRSFYGYRA